MTDPALAEPIAQVIVRYPLATHAQDVSPTGSTVRAS
jgi:hypothetical protein